jgi:hypothetical protein
MHYKEAAARQTLSNMTIPKLLELWAETEKHPKSIEVATVRGWLMDTLEAKNHAAFDAWMDAETNDPTSYFV